MKNKNKCLVMAMLLTLPVILAFVFLSEPVVRTHVVVIGAGASGMTAALEAEKSGKEVILLEKMPYVGGNTARATAGMNAVGTPQQAVVSPMDQPTVFLEDILKSGHESNTLGLVEVLVKESASAVMWLEGLGADLSDVGILAGHRYARTHRPSGGQPVGNEIIKVLRQAVNKSSVDLRLEHKALKILTNKNQSVIGVKVMDRTGRTYKIKANQVVIATGGFGGSPETFVYYNQKLKGYITTNSPSATGDFITLVADLDVQLVDMSYIQTHPTVSPQYGMLITEAIRGNGGILINNSGERFADEMQNRDVLSEAFLAQDSREVYLIFNEPIRQSLAASDDYIDMNIIEKAHDLETLAQAIRIEPSKLIETLDRYNGFVEAQLDVDLGRKSLKMTLEEGPFYAVQVIPGVHYCMGGILIDEKARAIDANGRPIKGLYESVEASGGVHGMNRLGGNSLLDAVVFGRIAGKSASED